MAFDFNPADLELSIRHYLLRTPIRELSGANRALPELYPTMKADLEQSGIRIGDLFGEERITVVPSIGCFMGGLVDMRPAHGWTTYTYSFTLDCLCFVADSYGHIDRVATKRQHSQLQGDIQMLIADPGQGAIPYFLWNDDGTTMRVGTATLRKRNPKPRIRVTPSNPAGPLGFSADFVVDVMLRKVPNGV